MKWRKIPLTSVLSVLFVLNFQIINAQNLHTVWSDREWSYEGITYAGLAVDAANNSFILGRGGAAPPSFRSLDAFGNQRFTVNAYWDGVIDTYEALAIDGAGNPVTLGYKFGPPLTLALVKYNNAGAELWRNNELTPVAGKRSVVVDGNDNIIVAGLFGSEVDTVSGISLSAGGKSISSVRGSDVFIAKFSPAGEVLWLAKIGSNSHESFAALAADRENNILVTGQTVIDGVPATPFLAKISPDGSLLWQQKIMQSSISSYLQDIRVNSQNQYILPYIFTGDLTYEGVQYSSPDNEDVLFRTFNADGQFVSAFALGLRGTVTAKDWLVDLKNDHIYVGGHFRDSLATSGVPTLQTTNLQMFALETMKDGSIFATYKISRSLPTRFGRLAKNKDLFVVGLEDDVADDAFYIFTGRYRQTDPRVTLNFSGPQQTPIYAEEVIEIPLLMDTDENISFCQFVVEFDNQKFDLLDVLPGSNVGGLSLITNENLPFTPEYPGLNANVLIQLSGTATLTGASIEIARLKFKTKQNSGNTTLAFDTRDTHFGFSNASSDDLLPEEILLYPRNLFLDGQFGEAAITNVKSAFLDTVKVPFMLSVTKNVSHFQSVIEYDTTAFALLGAQAGPDAMTMQVSAAKIEGGTPVVRSGQFLLELTDDTPLTGRDKHVATLLFFPKKAPRTGSNEILNLIRYHSDSYFLTSENEQIPLTRLHSLDGLVDFDGTSWNLGVKVKYGATTNAVAGVGVTVKNPLNTDALTTGESGTAANIYHQGTVNLGYAKRGDQRNAITGKDALMLLFHLAFLDTLDSTEQMFADVNGDGRLSGSDAISLLRYIAYSTQGTANTGEWIFTPQNKNCELLSDTTIAAQAFLLGDISQNWGESNGSAGGVDMLTLTLDKFEKDGGNIALPLSVEAPGNFGLLQFAIDFDREKVQFIDFAPAGPLQKMDKLIVETETGVVVQLSSGNEILSGEALFLGRMQFSSDKLSNLRPTVDVDKSYFVSQDLVEFTDGDISVINGSATETVQVQAEVPVAYKLEQNYPNPFNPETTIAYAIPVSGIGQHVRIGIYSMNGRLVRQFSRQHATAGYFTVAWNGADQHGVQVSSGTYFCKISAGKFQQTIKMLLVK